MATGDVAARVRAIVGYIGGPKEEAPPKLGVSKSTLYRWMRGEGKSPSDDDLRRLAQVAGVPAWVMLDGFPEVPPDADGDLGERVALLEREMKLVRRLVEGGLPQPTGELRRRIAGDPTSPKPRPQSDSDPEAGAQ